jgi:transcriptional coactivator p15 (PC4)
MPTREIQKNKRELLRVSPSNYEGHDLINIRVFAPIAGSRELVPTRKGVSIAVDLVPELIDALLWALGQSCNDASDSEEATIDAEALDHLSRAAWKMLKQHGSAVHWDSAERIVLTGDLRKYTKWNLHYVLASRPDLFERTGSGCFRAR